MMANKYEKAKANRCTEIKRIEVKMLRKTGSPKQNGVHTEKSQC